MEKILRNKSGITLIALVITIIVLLVLSGVTITLTFGNNGILSKTQIGKDEYIKQEATQTINLKITSIQLQSYGENKSLATLQYLADKLCEDEDMEYVIKKQKEQASLDKIDVSNTKSIFTKLKKYPYEFEINNSLQLASIDGIPIAKVPENDEDSIISMTKSELQEFINMSIKDILKDYSTTDEMNSKYATKDELNNIIKNETNIPTLDWDNKIGITNNFKTIGASYTVPKNGIIRVVLDQNNTENCCLNLYTNAAGGMYKKYFANNTTSWMTFTDEFEVNKNDIITVGDDSVLEGFRTFYLEFIPYK